MTFPANLEDLRSGSKRALAQALAGLERNETDPGIVQLLSEAWADPKAHVIGVTGPPGVGKSSLVDILIKTWRGEGNSVGAVVVDPSSKVSGGALLGDRTRINTNPDDENVFVRSMAARDKLGGLSSMTAAASVLMRAVFDIVLIETVGVGQSETDIEHTADTVVFCVQPGSGDALQFMKAGIMEVPHIIAVTKSDLGAPARRAISDVKDAIGLTQIERDEWPTEVLGVSVQDLASIVALVRVLDRRWDWLSENQRRETIRRRNDEAYVSSAIKERFGRDGLELVQRLKAIQSGSPFSRVSRIAKAVNMELRDP